MGFTPARTTSFDPSDAQRILDAQLSAKANRGRSIVHPNANAPRRLAWRAVVRSRDHDSLLTEWHLVGCADWTAVNAHCPEGRRLIQTIGQPEGHCMVEGRCLLCDLSG